MARQSHNPKAWQPLPEITIRYSNKVKMHQRPLANNSRDLWHLFRDNWDFHTLELYETFKVILLNSDSRALGIFTAGTGGLDAVVADRRIIFATALKAGAVAMACCHNHPSGELKPSEEDIELTEQLIEVATIHLIDFRDHLIISKYGYYSMSDEEII